MLVFIPHYAKTTALSGTYTGTVYLDYNANGARDTSGTSPNYAVDSGVSDVVVTAYNSSGVSVGSATTATNGTYALTPSGSGPYRFEFTSLPSGYYPSAVGTNNATTVRFVNDGGASNIDLGLSLPSDYTQNLPDLATNCYVYADQVTGPYNANAALINFPYEAGSVYTSTTASDYDPPTTHSLMLLANQIGTTWGLAYARTTDRLYTAAYYKRHTGFGKGADGTVNTSDDPGAIYVINPATNTVVSTFTVPGATTNPHDTSDYLTDNGNTGWDAVGKYSLGGLDLSDDDANLYVINLENRTLYRLNPSTGAVLASQQVPLSPPNSPTSDSPDVDIRPFAVEYYHGQLYIGLVCSAQSTGSTSDLWAYVYTANPTTLAFSANPVFQMALNYPRGKANGGTGQDAEWRVWQTTFGGSISGTRFVVNPQPLLTSLAFETDNLILGFRDRVGDQIGNSTKSKPGDETLYEPRTAGEVLRACGNPTDGWTIESNGRCGGNGNAPQSTGQGPSQGEFYYQDDYSIPANSANYHDEVLLGGLVNVPGILQTLSTAFDPIPAFDLANTFDNGLRWLNGSNGSTDRAYRVFDGTTGDLSTLGKASGLGDLVVLSDPAPLQLGNRVWTDTNGNGVQDPGENGIQNVTVELWTGGSKVGQATTDSSGNYYFGGASGINMRYVHPTCTTSVSVSVASSTDDAEQRSSGAISTTSTDLELLYDDGVPSSQLVGTRFTGVAVPQGATITGAYIEFTPRSDGDPVSSGNPNITIRGQAADNPGTFTATSNDISSRATTTASASWSPSAWSVGTNYQTAALTSIVQELVNRSGWVGGNSMVFIFSGDASTAFRRAWSYNGNTSSAPRLVITYSCPEEIYPNTAYEIRIPNATGGSKQSALGTAELVTANTDPDTNGDARDSDATFSSLTAVISLTTGGYGENNHTYDFGFVPSTTTVSYSVGNRVWFDTDNDGVMDGGESGVSGVTVDLLNSSDTQIATTTTDASGYYRFDNVSAGTGYRVRVRGTNFGSSGALNFYQSSTGNTSATDQRDNGVDPANLANGVYSSSFNLGASLQPTAEPDFTSSGNGAHGTNGDVSDNLTVDFGFTPSSPTAVRLAEFTAQVEGAITLASPTSRGPTAIGVTISWRTGFEVDSLGFNLYRDEGGQRIKLNPSLIAGSALLARSNTRLTAGNAYVWTDRHGQAGASYWLEEVDLSGVRTWYGPVLATSNNNRLANAETSRPPAPLLRELNDAPSQPSQTEWASDDAPSGQFLYSRASATDPRTLPWTLPNQSAAKLAVRKPGWYRVTQAELAAIGFNTNVNPTALQLFADGAEVPIRVYGKGSSGFDALEFYGCGLNLPSTDTRVYWLAAGNQAARRWEIAPGKQPDRATVNSFETTVELKERSTYFSGLLNGEAENWFGPVITPSGVVQKLTTRFVNYQASAPARLELALQGVTEQAHAINVELNGRPVGIAHVNQKARAVSSFSISTAWLREGENELKLVATLGTSDVSLVDWVRLTYPRAYRAENEALNFTLAAGQTALLTGFSTPAVRVLQLSSPDQAGERQVIRELHVKAQLAQDAYGRSYGFTLYGDGGAYLALGDQRLERVAKVTLNQPSDWRATGNAADFLILTHSAFKTSANKLALTRRAQGWLAAVVDVEDAYDEFGYGAHTPQAVKALLTHASRSWQRKPGFVLFLGSGINDPRDYQRTGAIDFIPVRLGDTAFLETALENWFVDANEDGLPEMALGRLPVRSAEQAETVINKILNFKPEPIWRSALLVSDRASNGYDFPATTQQLARELPTLMIKQFINRSDGGVEQVRNQIVQSVNLATPLLVNWNGHGSPAAWTGSGLLRRQEAAALTNRPLALFVMVTCLNGYFIHYTPASLAEDVLLSPAGGAFSVVASSAMTPPMPQGLFSQIFYRTLFRTNSTLGEAFKTAKSGAVGREVRDTYVLLGDPTLRLAPLTVRR